MRYVDVTHMDSVALIRINRPPLNAISTGVAMELEAAFDACAQDSVRAVVIAGQDNFAAGGDITRIQGALLAGASESTGPALGVAIGMLETLRKPTIAAITGYALGGGLELALGADFRYVATDSVLGQPEVCLGLIPGAGGTQRLPRLVGLRAARELIYSGRHIGAPAAAEIGLADRILPTDEVISTALDDAQTWSKMATAAIGAAKHAINAGTGRELEDALDIEREEFSRCFQTSDAVEGVDAFIWKRAPTFRGD